MKTRINKSRPNTWLVMAALVTLLSLGAVAQNSSPGIMPINSKPDGKSYGSWTAAWWQWVLGIPAAQNPMLDTTGQYAGVNQSGPMFFLPTTFGNSAERTFAVPSGKHLLLAAHPWIFGASAGDCNPSAPGVPCDVATLRDAAANAATSVQTLEVTIDGVAVKNVLSYRAISPDSFAVNLPADNALQALGITSDTAGTYAPQVADGYWLILTPLSPGNHTITVHTVNPDFGVNSVVISHITVN